MKEGYIIWINNGISSIAGLDDFVNTKTANIMKPCMVINMQYGVTKDGQLTNPDNPASVKMRFNADIIPYFFTEHLKDDTQPFTLDLTGCAYHILEGDSSPIVQQYKEVIKTI